MTYDANGDFNSSQDKLVGRFAAQQTVNWMTAMLIKALVEAGGRTPATAGAAALFALTRGAVDGIVSSNEGSGATLGGIAAGLATGVAAYVGASVLRCY